MPKLTPVAQFYVDDFAEDARDHGLKQEWGVGKEVQIAENLYTNSKAALEKYIAGLQEQVRKLKDLNKRHGWVQPGVH